MAIEQITGHIQNKNNFLLSGGAGSGKTYTLMETLDTIFEHNKYAKVACITYTNVAVNEIKGRSPYQNLTVSTIHEFLWSQIKNYQKDLKSSLVSLVANGSINHRGEDEITEELLQDKKIVYQEYKKLENGVVSHDEIIKLAHYMFESFLMLNDILKDKFDFILVDEYQDTQKEVIEIFLEHLQRSHKDCVLGFFGDSMQSIYNGRVGNIQSYIDSGLVEEVIKSDNYRCSINVIGLINHIRNDGITQQPANDNIAGDVKFIYTQNENISISDIKNNAIFENWDFSDIKETKELYLTHKLIAKEQGFSSLLNILSNDEVTGDTPNKLIAHLLKIEEIIFLYENRLYNEFIKKTNFKMKNLSDKQILKDKIDELKNTNNKTIEEVISLAHSLGLIKKDNKLNNYIQEREDKYNSVKVIQYQEIRHLYSYMQKLSPYSTQHGVKGAEFDNVFVILDNGSWNLYNFKYLFEETPNKESVIDRTRKIFYVSCSRAKENLVVFFHKPSSGVIDKAKIWFGEVNVIEI
jgi:DNA helicase-2/ATP-dependent DNA helicase PcrA